MNGESPWERGEGVSGTAVSLEEIQKVQQGAIDAQYRVNAAALTAQMFAESYEVRSIDSVISKFGELFDVVFNKMSGREASA